MGDHSALHQVDQQRRQTDLEHVGTHREGDRLARKARRDNPVHEILEVRARVDVRQRVHKALEARHRVRD